MGTLPPPSAIVGAGTIGLLLIQCLRASGCGLIIAVDVAKDRLERVRGLGADHAMDSSSMDVPAEVFRLTNGLGADAAFEAGSSRRS